MDQVWVERNSSRARRGSAGEIYVEKSDEEMSAMTGPKRRKFSFPASLHSSILNQKTLAELHASASIATRRRFSNVGDVISGSLSRKLSTTIGWRNAAIPTQDLVRHGKTLCGQYIRNRLKRSGLFSKKCGLQRLRSAANLPDGMLIRAVFPELLAMGLELEQTHPKLYTGIMRQAGGGKGPRGSVLTEKYVRTVLANIARWLFRGDITWAKVVSMFAVAGGMAADCARKNHVEFVPAIVDTMGEIIEDELASWINNHGGWISLQTYCKPKTAQISFPEICFYSGGILVGLLAFVLSLKWYGQFVFV